MVLGLGKTRAAPGARRASAHGVCGLLWRPALDGAHPSGYPGPGPHPCGGRMMDRATAAADYLFELRQAKRRVPALPVDIAPRSLAEGYAVQERLVQKLLDRFGGRPVGYKIACTSDLAQRALG